MSSIPQGLRVVRPVPAVEPAVLLDQVTAFASRFSVFPDEHCAPTLALWYAHTHAAAHFYTTPRLILDSAEPGSGKTRVLEVAQYLVRKPEMTISITTAAIFRMLTEGPVTLLFDEIDTIFSAKAGGNNEDLRGLLNSGYKRSATVSRCVGDASRMKVERFPVFAPVALAGIAGAMPATITTRAITIHMRRRAPHERAEPFRERKVEKEAEPLREQLAEWLDRVGADELAGAEPVMPDGVTDRAAEVWEPLIAIADVAGGPWLEQLLPALRDGARWVIAGAVAGPVVTFDLRRLYLHNLSLIGSSMHTRAHFASLADLARVGTVHPRIAGSYRLTELHAAQEEFLRGTHVGKITITP